MEEVNFKARLKAVNIAERKVNLGVKQFLAVNLTEVDVTNYGDRLKEIRNKLDFYNDTVIELICDLDAFDTTDQPRIANLEKQQDDLSDSVVRNEKDVKEKIKELLAAQPMSQAEKETLELKKRQISVEDEEKKNAKADKAKKILIDMDDISSRFKNLLEIIFDINKATDLSDQDVRQHLLDSKRWESKLEDIVSSKVKVHKDIIGVDVDSETVGKLKDIVEKVKTSVRGKVAELKKVDVERCLYSLSKAVKGVAVYPPIFGGTDGEDVYKFKEKMIEAITTNQIREKDKTEVLRKHLKGKAKTMIGEHYENLDKAFGLAKKTWDHKLKEFVKTVNRPQDWIAHGTITRAKVIGQACEFLREAEKLLMIIKISRTLS